MIDTFDITHEVLGTRLFCRVWQPRIEAAEPPITLMHDSLGCVEMWRDFPNALCSHAGRTVLAYDRAGFGHSEARADLPSLDFIAKEGKEVFPALLDKLGLKRVTLLGHSVGGCMAVEAAANHPSLVSAIITLSAPAFLEQRTLDGITAARSFFRQPANFTRLQKYHGKKAGWVLDAWTEVWRAPGFCDWSLAPALKRLRSPLLAIHGAQDEYGSNAFPETLSREAAAGCDMHILPDVGHMPFREAPEAVIKAVSVFLDPSAQQLC